MNLILCAQEELTGSTRKRKKLLAFLKLVLDAMWGVDCSRGEKGGGETSQEGMTVF